MLISLTVMAALGSGLIAGFFFAFSVLVMKALSRMLPAHGIIAMQTINVVVLNPWFFTAFFGTAAIAIVLVVYSFFRLPASGVPYLLAAGALYLVGVIGVTIAFNVPLNNALAAVDPDSTEGARMWERYLYIWTNWNHVRTAASLAAAAAYTLAL